MINIIKLENINIHKFGNDWSFGGMLLSNGRTTVLVPLPEENDNIKTNDILIVDLDDEGFNKIIKQTDLLDVEVAEKNKKIVLRKSQRQIDSGLAWKVFQRDNYTCRYCGITGVPMTFDHVLLWEYGGPTIEENGITACRKCNKTRGNTEFKDWLNSDYYKRVSKNVNHDLNLDVLKELEAGNIKSMKFKRNR